MEPPTGPQSALVVLEMQAGFDTRMHEQGDASAIERAVKGEPSTGPHPAAVKGEPSTGPHPAAPKKLEVRRGAQGSGFMAEVPLAAPHARPQLGLRLKPKAEGTCRDM